MKTLLFAIALTAMVPRLTDAREAPKYPVALIPAELKNGVDVVVRKDFLLYTIHGRDRATQYVFYAATIFNANGADHAELTVPYDKISKITALKASIYDAYGNLIKKLKPTEIIDHAAVDGFTLYSDNRLKYVDLKYNSFPYTIEIEYEIRHDFQFYIPSFYVQSGERTAVENAEFKLMYPVSLKPKYKTYNIEQEPIQGKVDDNTESMSWVFANIKPMTFESYSPALTQMKYIAAAPTSFEFGGYQGTLGSWNELGLWLNTLNKGRNVLPETTRSHLISLTKDLPTREAKVKAVYEYMQNRTRYVGIQLGIGGFQPFDAATVDKTGYGDCKALSNYMVSMLNAIEIKAHYVVVYAGANNAKLDVTFPSSQFNHVIVCVPNEKDTLWLECTSQNNPFGYMGTFTGNRKALAITENGASIVNTPVYTETHNIQSRFAHVTITPDGNAMANVKTSYQGIQYENDDLDRSFQNYDDQKKWILENTQIPTFDLSAFTITHKKERIPIATVDLKLSLNRFCTVNGKRLFLTPNLMNRSTTVVPKVEGRKNPVYLKNPFSDYDTIHYEIPEQLYPEFVPSAVSIKSEFGEYQSSYTQEQGRLIYVRKFVRKGGSFPAASYNALIDFYKQINKADNAKVVFLNKT